MPSVRRKTRFSRSRRRSIKPKEPTPRFMPGDYIGSFTVTEYLGWNHVKPVGEPTKLSQEHHWYRVDCDCGTEEIHTQQQLIDTRRHRKCADCIRRQDES